MKESERLDDLLYKNLTETARFIWFSDIMDLNNMPSYLPKLLIKNSVVSQ
jgi:hypothetical protein